MAKFKEPTRTSIVLRALRDADDFRSVMQLRDATGLDIHNVWSAVMHLKKFKAIDVEIDKHGTSYWYARPTCEDTRHCVHDERTPEVRPRRKKRVNPAKPAL